MPHFLKHFWMVVSLTMSHAYLNHNIASSTVIFLASSVAVLQSSMFSKMDLIILFLYSCFRFWIIFRHHRAATSMSCWEAGKPTSHLTSGALDGRCSCQSASGCFCLEFSFCCHPFFCLFPSFTGVSLHHQGSVGQGAVEEPRVVGVEYII